MNNPSIESHFAICHIASFSSQLSITMKRNKLFKEEKFKVQIGISYNEEISYSKYKIDINYNKENKLFKVQKRCVFLILHKWSCSLYTPITNNFKCLVPRIPGWLLMSLFPALPLNLIHQLDELTPDHVLILLFIDLHFLDDFYIEQSLYE